MTTQDGYDWPTPRPEAPEYIAQTPDGLVIVSDRQLVDSGMTFRGVPLMFDGRAMWRPADPEQFAVIPIS